MRSTVTFFKAMPVMPLTKAHSQRSMAWVLHSLVLASQMAWPTRTNVALSATRCKLRSALVKWLAARKSMQQMIHQHHLIPYSILVKDPPICSLRCPAATHWRSGITHMAYHTRRICISNPHSSSLHSCVFVKHPFPEQFSWFATFVQRHHQVLTPSFDLRFITQLFNRTPSHTICLSLCSYSAQSQSRLGLKCAREINNYRL
jgi:hypothetical protein